MILMKWSNFNYNHSIVSSIISSWMKWKWYEYLSLLVFSEVYEISIWNIREERSVNVLPENMIFQVRKESWILCSNRNFEEKINECNIIISKRDSYLTHCDWEY